MYKLINYFNYNYTVYRSTYLRFVYDLLAITYVIGCYWIYTYLYNIDFDYKLLLLAPLILSINYFFGIYILGKNYKNIKKNSLIIISTTISFFAISINYSEGIFFINKIYFFLLLVLLPLMILPRIFLNLQSGKRKKLLNVISREKGPILVVGGAGYIGVCVVDLLLKNKKQVRVLDKLMYGKKPLHNFLNNPDFELIEGDATDITKLTEAMIDTSAVIHLAGLVGDPACSVNEDYTRHTNIITTRMIKDLVIALEIPRLIFASSCSVYGSSEKEVNEESRLNPVSLYAETKIDSEKELLSYVPDNLNVTILRFATVFGHSDRPRFDLVTNLFCAAAMQENYFKIIGPNQFRPFIHVKDLARAVLLVLDSSNHKVRNQIFNVGDNSLNITIGDLGKKVFNIAKEYNAKVDCDVIDDVEDKRNYYVSFNKIENILKFKALYDLNFGIRELIEKIYQKTFDNFREDKYNNVVITKKQIDDFENSLNYNLYTSLKK